MLLAYADEIVRAVSLRAEIDEVRKGRGRQLEKLGVDHRDGGIGLRRDTVGRDDDVTLFRACEKIGGVSYLIVHLVIRSPCGTKS